MELAILGSGAAFADTGHQAGYLVDGSLLLDCGAPAAVLLPRMGVDVGDLQAVAITHLHGDHVGQLPTLLAARALRRPQAAPLLLIGPRGLEGHIATLGDLAIGKRFWDATMAANPPIIKEVEDGDLHRVGNHVLQAFEVEHAESLHCLAFRVESPEVVLGYSGDTTLCAGIRRLSKMVDHLLCECTGWSAPAPVHLWREEVEELMRDAPRTSFILTHLSERRPVPGAILASDGLRLRLSRSGRG
jgi:ribonuclease BN (tRNA processing enzyme)